MVHEISFMQNARQGHKRHRAFLADRAEYEFSIPRLHPTRRIGGLTFELAPSHLSFDLDGSSPALKVDGGIEILRRSDAHSMPFTYTHNPKRPMFQHSREAPATISVEPQRVTR